MKNYGFMLIALLLVSCSDNNSSTPRKDRIDYLTDGKWKVLEFEGKENKFSQGIVFSKDRQFFHLDSQGRIIPKQMEVVFELKNDTLKVVDFNYEQRFIYKKGTQIFIVKTLDEDELLIEGVHPDSTSSYKLRKEEL